MLVILATDTLVILIKCTCIPKAPVCTNHVKAVGCQDRTLLLGHQYFSLYMYLPLVFRLILSYLIELYKIRERKETKMKKIGPRTFPNVVGTSSLVYWLVVGIHGEPTKARRLVLPSVHATSTAIYTPKYSISPLTLSQSWRGSHDCGYR